MPIRLDDFDCELQCEDAEFVALFEDAAYASFLREQAEEQASEIEEDLYARDFIFCQEDQDEYDKMKESVKNV